MKKRNKEQEAEKRHLAKMPVMASRIIMSLIGIALLLLSICQAKAMPQIQLTSIANPLEYGQMQKITLNITANSTIEQALIEFNGQNHSLQKENDYYIYSWVPGQKGNNSYSIYTTDAQNETQTYIGSFIVQDTTPPQIIEAGPQGNLNYNLVELRAETNENSTCRYDQADVSYDSMYFDLSGEGISHTKLRNFGDGQYNLYILCKDSSGNIGPSKAINFIIDTTPPVITYIDPTGTVNQPQVTLKISTDEIASCKWSKINKDYDAMENYFQATNSINHEQPLTLLDGINSFFIICKDKMEHKNFLVTVNLELNLPPTALITIEKNNSYPALAQGTYEVKLTSSKALANAPILQLKYTNRLINVPLEWASREWTGYLIIPQEQIEDVGEFVFSGTDSKGTPGNEITSGKLVLLDTTLPIAPTELKILNENNTLRVSWDYTGEDSNHFNIYRSTTGKTDKSNYKSSITGKAYYDRDVTSQIGYFYRVSAVDNAGNEGPLSDEEFLMADLQNATNQFKQDPDILELINNKITELEKVLQGLDLKISSLEQKTDEDLVEIMNEEALIDKQKEIKNNIQTLVGELKTYKESKITSDELQAKIEIINTKVTGYKNGIIQDVIIKDKVQNEQVIEDSLLQQTIQSYLENKQFSPQQAQNYESMVKELQKKVRVEQGITKFEISYEYKENDEITMLKENIITSEEIKGMLAQEVIPKEVVKISDITFQATPLEINEQGVIFALKKPADLKILYTTKTEKDLDQMQSIRTIMIYDSDQFLSALAQENQSTKITGSVIAGNQQQGSSSQSTWILLGLGMIVIGLLIYYFIFLKSESPAENKPIMNSGITPEDKNESNLTEISLNNQLFNRDIKNNQTNAAPDSNFVQILRFIKEGYENLDAGNIDVAKESYAFALSKYNSVKLGLKDRMQANFEMNTLWERLSKV
jgi:hypothetical protein